MTEADLIETGYALSTRLGGYSLWERGTYPETVVLYPDGTCRVGIYSRTQTNAQEMLRDLALQRVLSIVIQLPNIQAYPAIAVELTTIRDSLAITGEQV